jgi:hypothetical protein
LSTWTGLSGSGKVGTQKPFSLTTCNRSLLANASGCEYYFDGPWRLMICRRQNTEAFMIILKLLPLTLPQTPARFDHTIEELVISPFGLTFNAILTGARDLFRN